MSYSDAREIGLDGVRLDGSIYQGALPTTGPALSKAGFGYLVNCAAEICAIDNGSYPGVIVLPCPLYDLDAPVTPDMWALIDRASAFAADAHARKECVLIACQQGRNRSALVAAAALRRLSPTWSGARCVEFIRNVSPRTFKNESFARAVTERWP